MLKRAKTITALALLAVTVSIGYTQRIPIAEVVVSQAAHLPVTDDMFATLYGLRSDGEVFPSQASIELSNQTRSVGLDALDTQTGLYFGPIGHDTVRIEQAQASASLLSDQYSQLSGENVALYAYPYQETNDYDLRLRIIEHHRDPDYFSPEAMTFAQQFYKVRIEPGEDLHQAMRFTIVTDSYGSVFAREFESALYHLLEAKGYNPQIISESFKQTRVFAFGIMSDPTSAQDRPTFTTIGFLYQNDNRARLEDADTIALQNQGTGSYITGERTAFVILPPVSLPPYATIRDVMSGAHRVGQFETQPQVRQLFTPYWTSQELDLPSLIGTLSSLSPDSKIVLSTAQESHRLDPSIASLAFR